MVNKIKLITPLFLFTFLTIFLYDINYYHCNEIITMFYFLGWNRPNLTFYNRLYTERSFSHSTKLCGPKRDKDIADKLELTDGDMAADDKHLEYLTQLMGLQDTGGTYGECLAVIRKLKKHMDSIKKEIGEDLYIQYRARDDQLFRAIRKDKIPIKDSPWDDSSSLKRSADEAFADHTSAIQAPVDHTSTTQASVETSVDQAVMGQWGTSEAILAQLVADEASIARQAKESAKQASSMAQQASISADQTSIPWQVKKITDEAFALQQAQAMERNRQELEKLRLTFTKPNPQPYEGQTASMDPSSSTGVNRSPSPEINLFPSPSPSPEVSPSLSPEVNPSRPPSPEGDLSTEPTLLRPFKGRGPSSVPKENVELPKLDKGKGKLLDDFEMGNTSPVETQDLLSLIFPYYTLWVILLVVLCIALFISLFFFKPFRKKIKHFRG